MLNWVSEKTAVLMAMIQSVLMPKVRAGLAGERGDTNFISILIILGIVIIVAGVFIGFKDQIVEQVEGIVSGFTIQ